MNYRAGGVFVAVMGASCLIPALAGAFNDGTPSASAATSIRIEGKRASNKQLDHWIVDSLKVMKANEIPGSYQSIHRNIIRESGGNPKICNYTDVNADNGVPSCGLLQIIQPTFDAHKLPQSAYDKAGVKADADDRFDPVTNIVTACAYAWSRYPNGLQIKGKPGIDGVKGPY